MVVNNKFVFINRGFWPEYDVPGESLLNTAELLGEKNQVTVLTSSNLDVEKECLIRKRAENIKIKTMSSLSNSNSSILKRALESIIFCFWVLLNLLKIKPNYIYFATDPPLSVPFIVYFYSYIFKVKYVYHLQDIHPEATGLTVKLPSFVYDFLMKLDNKIIKRAFRFITLNKTMRNTLSGRGLDIDKCYILNNASIYPQSTKVKKKGTIIFAGNAGRFQNIKILTDSIQSYLIGGGNLNFIFIGGGIYSNLFDELGYKFDNVTVMKYLPANKTMEIMCECEWGILPIREDILKYAFPSKASAYIAAKLKILAICTENSAVHDFINENNNGLICESNTKAIVSKLIEIENGIDFKCSDLDVSMESFSLKLIDIISGQNVKNY